MFRNLFKRKDYTEIYSPTDGTILPIEEVPDEVFSQRIVGDGFAIKPKDNKIYSPVSGEVIVLFPTLHGIAIRTESGLEVLIHVGINTMSIGDDIFTSSIEVGDRVEKGDLLVTFKKELLESHSDSLITPVVVTNMDIVEKIVIDDYGLKSKGKLIGKIRLI